MKMNIEANKWFREFKKQEKDFKATQLLLAEEMGRNVELQMQIEELNKRIDKLEDESGIGEDEE